MKNYFEPYGENQEIRIGGYVADIVGENGVIEIQTRQFNKLLKKLEAFLDYCDVTVVYPIPAVKYVRWIDTETGELSEKHKSPRKYTIYEVMPELYKIKYTLDNPRFHLCLCMLETEEIRLLNGWSKNKSVDLHAMTGYQRDLLTRYTLTALPTLICSSRRTCQSSSLLKTLPLMQRYLVNMHR